MGKRLLKPVKLSERPDALRVIQKDWENCHRCPLGAAAFKHVLYELPTDNLRVDILFIGEAPGRSEDTLGRPFIGRAGKFLRETIEEAGSGGLYIGYSNLLACRPTDDNDKDRQPAAVEVAACSGRLIALVNALQPFAVVALGRVPETYLPPIINRAKWKGMTAAFKHPSWVIRTGGKSSIHYPEYLESFRQLFNEVRNA